MIFMLVMLFPQLYRKFIHIGNVFMTFRIIGSGMGTRIGYPSPNFDGLQHLVFDTLATGRPLKPCARVAFTKESIADKIPFRLTE